MRRIKSRIPGGFIGIVHWNKRAAMKTQLHPNTSKIRPIPLSSPEKASSGRRHMLQTYMIPFLFRFWWNQSQTFWHASNSYSIPLELSSVGDSIIRLGESMFGLYRGSNTLFTKSRALEAGRYALLLFHFMGTGAYYSSISSFTRNGLLSGSPQEGSYHDENHNHRIDRRQKTGCVMAGLDKRAFSCG